LSCILVFSVASESCVKCFWMLSYFISFNIFVVVSEYSLPCLSLLRSFSSFLTFSFSASLWTFMYNSFLPLLYVLIFSLCSCVNCFLNANILSATVLVFFCKSGNILNTIKIFFCQFISGCYYMPLSFSSVCHFLSLD